jgi:holo-[acyl-carrier protein] synthase
MLAGLGIDIVDVARMEQGLRRDGVDRPDGVFTTAELARSRRAAAPARHLACCFAAKEALFKALGRGWQGGFAWRGVELAEGDDGGSQLVLSGEVKAAAERMGASRLHVSVSHTAQLAMASVVLEV